MAVTDNHRFWAAEEVVAPAASLSILAPAVMAAMAATGESAEAVVEVAPQGLARHQTNPAVLVVTGDCLAVAAVAVAVASSDQTIPLVETAAHSAVAAVVDRQALVSVMVGMVASAVVVVAAALRPHPEAMAALAAAGEGPIATAAMAATPLAARSSYAKAAR
jgi:hypothetical protein